MENNRIIAEPQTNPGVIASGQVDILKVRKLDQQKQSIRLSAKNSTKISAGYLDIEKTAVKKWKIKGVRGLVTENRNIIRVLGIDLNTLKQILIEVNYKALDDFAEEERVIVFVRNQRKILVERI